MFIYLLDILKIRNLENLEVVKLYIIKYYNTDLILYGKLDSNFIILNAKMGNYRSFIFLLEVLRL